MPDCNYRARPQDCISRAGNLSRVVRPPPVQPCPHPPSAPPNCADRSTTTTTSITSRPSRRFPTANSTACSKNLQEIEAEHPELVTPDSPTQRVGGEPIDGFHTVTHREPMLSIDNTYNPDQLREWDRSTRKLLGGEAVDLRRRTEDRRRRLLADLRERPIDRRRHARRRRARRRRDSQHPHDQRGAAAICIPTTRRRCSRSAARST